MTIKIIQRNEPKKQEKECTCTKCRSVLLVSKEDTEYVPDPQRGEDFWSYSCPVCATRNYIYSWKN